jgi:signal transduction histidine kinase
LQTEAKRKDDFIALLAHELRNPLAPIRTSARILNLQMADNPMAVKCLDIIERQVAIMSRLLDDLLDISRINKEIIRLEWRPFRIIDAVRAALDTVQEILDHHKQRVNLHAGAEELFVYGDVVRMEQVFVNLLNNAAKYSGGPGHIDITVDRHGPLVSISIKDTGIGISSDLLPHVFEAFVQGARSIDRSAGGLGVGLNFAKRLVELHHGEIVARSEGIGRGSEFEVRLPLLTSETRGLG